MQVPRYVGIWVCRYLGMQVPVYVSTGVCRYLGVQLPGYLGTCICSYLGTWYLGMQVTRNIGTQECRYRGMQVPRNVSTQDCRYLGMQLKTSCHSIQDILSNIFNKPLQQIKRSDWSKSRCQTRPLSFIFIFLSLITSLGSIWSFNKGISWDQCDQIAKLISLYLASTTMKFGTLTKFWPKQIQILNN